ncbi:MAG TPA: radical SAM protein [Spirochaetota bacterium]|nr:radical SAM protein [Spirochaetota bacterium]
MASPCILINTPQPERGRLVCRDMAGGFGYETGKAVILPPLSLIYHGLALQHTRQILFYDLTLYPEREKELLHTLKTISRPLIIATAAPLTVNSDLEFFHKIKDLSPLSSLFVKINYPCPETITLINRSPAVNTILKGETELIIKDIIKDHTSTQTASHKQYKNKYQADWPRPDLNKLPAMDPLFIQKHRYRYILLRDRRKKLFSYQSSRGCPFPCCSYCPYPVSEGRKWRAVSAEKMFRDLKLLVVKHNYRLITFRDALFTYNKKRILKLCTMIIKNKLRFKWWCETRIDCLDKELIENMAAAGLKGIHLGLETGAVRELGPQAKPGLDLKKIKNINKLLQAVHIRVHFLMLAGLPGESKKTVVKTFRFIRKFKPDSLGISSFVPYPGTTLSQKTAAAGHIKEKNISRYNGKNTIAATDRLSLRQVKEAVRFLQQAQSLNKKRSFTKFFLVILINIKLLWWRLF